MISGLGFGFWVEDSFAVGYNGSLLRSCVCFGLYETQEKLNILFFNGSKRSIDKDLELLRV